VSNDANDRDPGRILGAAPRAKGDALADGVDAHEIFLHELFVDDDDWLPGGYVAVVEQPTALERNPERREEARTHRANVAPRTVLPRRHDEVFDREAARGPAAAERQ